MKEYKPITPSLRHKKIIKNLPKFKPFKQLIHGLKKTGFRNNTGKVTIRHRGGGNPRRLRIIDIERKNGKNAEIEVLKLEKDPIRTTYIALCRTQKIIGENIINIKGNEINRNKSVRIQGYKYFYILAPQNIKPGDIISSKTIGGVNKLSNLLVGTIIHNLEINPGQGGKLIRAGGTYGTIIKKVENQTYIKLPSKRIINVSSDCIATLGINSNENNNKIVLGKAGASRWIGRRPIVRGEVMNPIDHPHGGKTRGGRPLKNIWGKLAKWVPTHKEFSKKGKEGKMLER